VYANSVNIRKSSLKEREAILKEQEFFLKWVEISLNILRDPKTRDQATLQKWAVQVANIYAPEHPP
jgi:hypothetical protein